MQFFSFHTLWSVYSAPSYMGSNSSEKLVSSLITGVFEMIPMEDMNKSNCISVFCSLLIGIAGYTPDCTVYYVCIIRYTDIQCAFDFAPRAIWTVWQFTCTWWTITAYIWRQLVEVFFCLGQKTAFHNTYALLPMGWLTALTKSLHEQIFYLIQTLFVVDGNALGGYVCYHAYVQQILQPPTHAYIIIVVPKKIKHRCLVLLCGHAKIISDTDPTQNIRSDRLGKPSNQYTYYRSIVSIVVSRKKWPFFSDCLRCKNNFPTQQTLSQNICFVQASLKRSILCCIRFTWIESV